MTEYNRDKKEVEAQEEIDGTVIVSAYSFLFLTRFTIIWSAQSPLAPEAAAAVPAISEAERKVIEEKSEANRIAAIVLETEKRALEGPFFFSFAFAVDDISLLFVDRS